MLQGSMGLDDSLSSAISNEASINSSSNVNGGIIRQQQQQQQYNPTLQPPSKKRRNLPGNPDPDAEVVALSPRSLVATNRFVCEMCNKGFQREQNLQLHRRGHNLPWKLKQRSKEEVIRKKVYVCPEASCVHHHPARALGDLTGIKKHFSRKHGEKKWKCHKCSKRYAVHSDWKAHSKICGTREYPCHCGTLFSRRDSFITHRAFCDALAEDNSRGATAPNQFIHHPLLPLKQETLNFTHPPPWLSSDHHHHHHLPIFPPIQETPSPNTSLFPPSAVKPPPLMSATALLQMAAYDEDHHHDHRESGAPGFCSATTAGGLPSREEMLHGLAAYGGSKLANLTAACMETSSGNNIIQEHHVSMLPSTSGFDGFDDSFNGIFSAKGNAIPSFQQDAHFMGLRKGGAAASGGGDGMTRDFLGLRGFPHSHRGLSNMAGLHQMGSSSSFDQNQAPWQS